MIATGFLGWAGILFAQNYSFTYVSRARSSGSLKRHFKAAIFSNGIWIFSQMLLLGPMLDYLVGKHGVQAQILMGLLYTVATVSGSLLSHFIAQRTEKGNERVGAHKDVASFTKAEGEQIRTLLAVHSQGIKHPPVGYNAAYSEVKY